MTHAADEVLTPAPAAPHRSQKLVRTVLLGACAAGLAGLALPGSPVTTSTLSAASSSSPTALRASVAGDLLHTPIFAVAPTQALPPRTPARASRSRTVTIAKTTAAPQVTDTWVRPSSAAIVSPFGPRWGRMHKGVDFGAHYGSPIVAIGDGTVLGAGYLPEEGGYGQITLIRHSNGFVSAYAHQSTMLVHAGDVVHTGEVIGYVGATGEVTGPHLHFEIRTQMHGGQINPVPWLRAHGVDV